jgi:hypothetical protein
MTRGLTAVGSVLVAASGRGTMVDDREPAVKVSRSAPSG